LSRGFLKKISKNVLTNEIKTDILKIVMIIIIVFREENIQIKNYSRKREAILSKIRSTTCHPTADEVYMSLKEEYPDLSLGTVYRNLSLFKKEGSVIAVAVVDGQERYDGCTSPHGHFVCYKCSAVTDVDLPLDQTAFISYLRNTQQCHVDKVDCTAYGVCVGCLEHKNK